MGIASRIGWIILALVGAAALGVVATARGEAVNAVWIVVAAVSVYLIAYRFYALYLAKIVGIDPARPTPAVRHPDGLDFVPTDRRVLFGHHFAAIAGAGPLVGPVLAAQMGYLPGMLWLLAGVVLAGAVQDFMVLFLSMRRDGAQHGHDEDERRRHDREREFGQQQHHEGPEDIELLFDGERPEDVEAVVPALAQRIADIGREERIPRPVVRPAETEQRRRDDHQQDVRRQDAAHAARIEVAEIGLPARLALEQDAGDQKAAQHEEQVDTHPQRRFERVLREHGEHGEGAQAIELDDAVGMLRWAGEAVYGHRLSGCFMHAQAGSF